MSLGCNALALATVVGATVMLSASPQPPLRVCADPNNMPFSNTKQQGFENRIASILAAQMQRPLIYLWRPERRGLIRTALNGGLCDVVMGAPVKSPLVRPTRPYYRSSYVFVSRQDRRLPIQSFDDDRLKKLTIGIQMTGDDYNNPPAAQALASHSLIENVRGFMVYGDYSDPDPQRAIVDAVANGSVDVAVVWGPLAGYYARHESHALRLVPVRKSNADPFEFVFDIAMGVRRGDGALDRELDSAIARRMPDIRKILTSYGVPLL